MIVNDVTLFYDLSSWIITMQIWNCKQTCIEQLQMQFSPNIPIVQSFFKYSTKHTDIQIELNYKLNDKQGEHSYQNCPEKSIENFKLFITPLHIIPHVCVLVQSVRLFVSILDLHANVLTHPPPLRIPQNGSTQLSQSFCPQ